MAGCKPPHNTPSGIRGGSGTLTSAVILPSIRETELLLFYSPMTQAIRRSKDKHPNQSGTLLPISPIEPLKRFPDLAWGPEEGKEIVREGALFLFQPEGSLQKAGY